MTNKALRQLFLNLPVQFCSLSWIQHIMRKVRDLGTRDQVNSMLYVTKGRELIRKFLADKIDKFFK